MHLFLVLDRGRPARPPERVGARVARPLLVEAVGAGEENADVALAQRDWPADPACLEAVENEERAPATLKVSAFGKIYELMM